MWRKIQELGLSRAYKESTEHIDSFVLRLCFGLPLLPVARIQEALGMIQDTARFGNAGARVFKFLRYVENTYIRKGCDFPPEMWAGLVGLSVPSSTNACESFHSKFNAMFCAPSPNIYVFLENLSD